MPEPHAAPCASPALPAPRRYVGLDAHKAYLVAVAVNKEQEQLLGPVRVGYKQLATWIARELTLDDAVVLEMSTNSWTLHDLLVPHVHSVTVVHPPHVALIVRARVMNDRKAALTLAQLHAAGLLPPVWVPPQPVRDLRALVKQRRKMVRLATVAKNRLHALLHRQNLAPPPGDLFHPKARGWWRALQLTWMERSRVEGDLATLAFATAERQRLDQVLATVAAGDERVPLLVQLPGCGHVLALTILAAIGDIRRFPAAQQLVGYAGLGTRVHDSGKKRWSGGITKFGRRDLRWAMVQMAQKAVRGNSYWRCQYERLERRAGKNKAIVAVARKLLVAVWHILTKEEVDRHAAPAQVAASLFALAYKVGVRRLPDRTAKQFVRRQLDRLGIGQSLKSFKWGSKVIKLPPSSLPA